MLSRGLAMASGRRKAMPAVLFKPEAHQAKAASGGLALAMKSILLHVQDDEGLEARLQASLALVRASGGHLHCLQVSPVNAFVGFETFGAGYVMADLLSELEQHEGALRSRIEKQLANEDVAWTYQQQTSGPGSALVNHGALSDLIVLGRFQHSQSAAFRVTRIFGAVLHATRTPLLLCVR